MSNNAEPIPYIHDLKKIILNDVYISKMVGDNKYGEKLTLKEQISDWTRFLKM